MSLARNTRRVEAAMAFDILEANTPAPFICPRAVKRMSPLRSRCSSQLGEAFTVSKLPLISPRLRSTLRICTRQQPPDFTRSGFFRKGNPERISAMSFSNFIFERAGRFTPAPLLTIRYMAGYTPQSSRLQWQAWTLHCFPHAHKCSLRCAC